MILPNHRIKQYRIFICEDHPIVRDALRLTLGTNPLFTVVGEAATVDDTLSRLDESAADILMLDLNLPGKGGFDLLDTIRNGPLRDRLSPVVFSMTEDRQTAEDAVKRGAKGYITKSTDTKSIHEALRRIGGGEIVLCTPAFGPTTGEDRTRPSESPLGVLSKREHEVFYLLLSGHPNRIIARQLHVSPRTIETNRARIIRKLGCCSTADLIRYSIRHGLSAP